MNFAEINYFLAKNTKIGIFTESHKFRDCRYQKAHCVKLAELLQLPHLSQSFGTLATTLEFFVASF